MAEKKEVSADSNERLKIWLSFAKFCFATFLICFTLLAINDQKMKTKIRIAKLESGCDHMDAKADDAHGEKSEAHDHAKK